MLVLKSRKLLLLLFFIFVIRSSESSGKSFVENVVLKKTVKNFVVMRIGGAPFGFFNNFIFFRHNSEGKCIDKIPLINTLVNSVKGRTNHLFKNICKAIKENKFQYFVSNYNFGTDILYNKHIRKSFFLSIGGSAKFESRLIINKYLENLKIYLNEFDKTKEEDLNYVFTEKDNNDVSKKVLEERQFELNCEGKAFEYLENKISKNCSVYNIKFLKIGACFGIAFLLHPASYENSFFMNVNIYLRYRKLIDFMLYDKNGEEKYKISGKYLRTNPVDISLGFEIGKGNLFSVLVECGLLSVLRNISNDIAGSSRRVVEKNKVSVRDFSIAVRYNIF